MGYLLELGFSQEEISNIEQTMNKDHVEMIMTFPKIVKINYELLKDLDIKNIKDVFIGHSQMFVINPDRFKGIFAKYDKADLVRCIEKNAAVIEKL